MFPLKNTLIFSGLLLLQPLAYATHLASPPFKTVDDIAMHTASPTDAITDDSGPFQLQFIHSNPLGNILNGHWTNYFTPSNAFGFELDFGPSEFRLGGTWGHALTQQQRFKITAEHLAQRPDYDFVGQDDTQWQGQNAFGANYQYLLDCEYVKALNFSAYVANAEDENFSTITFTKNQQTFIDIRHSTGANSYGAMAGLQLQFWSTGLIGLAANYDAVHYSPTYVSGPSRQGPGATASLDQLITDHLRFAASASDLQPYHRVQAELAWLAYTRPGRHLEIALLGSSTQGDTPVGTDHRAGLSLAYSWSGNLDKPPFVYSLPTLNNAYEDLSSWTAAPAVHLPEVLAVKDEHVALRQIN
jgi:hypothetical protein